MKLYWYIFLSTLWFWSHKLRRHTVGRYTRSSHGRVSVGYRCAKCKRECAVSI